MRSHTIADAPPAAGLDPGIRESLPPVVVGDKEESKREHAWPASLFYILAYLIAVGLGASALGCAAFAIYRQEPMLGLLAVVLGVGTFVQARLAHEVENFSAWGWYGAMVELGAASAAKVWAMAQGNPGAVVPLVIDLLWMKHFWEHRGDYDVDL